MTKQKCRAFIKIRKIQTAIYMKQKFAPRMSVTALLTITEQNTIIEHGTCLLKTEFACCWIFYAFFIKIRTKNSLSLNLNEYIVTFWGV